MIKIFNMIYTSTADVSTGRSRLHSDKKITMSFDEYESMVKKNLSLVYELAELREELELARIQIRELKRK